LPETVGTPGTSGTKREEIEIDRLVDSDIGVNGVVPGAVPNGTQSIRFVVDYSTDLPGRPYELVKEGTCAEVSPERAEHYIRKGVAVMVEAPA